MEAGSPFRPSWTSSSPTGKLADTIAFSTADSRRGSNDSPSHREFILTHRMEKQETEIMRIKQNLQNEREQNDRLNAQLNDAKVKLDQKNTELKDTSEVLRNLQGKVDETNKIRGDLSRKEHEARSLSDELSKLKETLKVTDASLLANQEQAQAVIKERGRLTTDFASVDLKYKDLLREVTEKEREFNEAKESNANSEVRIRGLTQLLDSTIEEKKELENDKIELKAKKDELDKRVLEIENEIKMAKEDLNGAARWQQKYKQQQEKAADLSIQLKNTIADLKNLEASEEAAKKLVLKYKDDIDRLTQKLSDLDVEYQKRCKSELHFQELAARTKADVVVLQENVRVQEREITCLKAWKAQHDSSKQVDAITILALKEDLGSKESAHEQELTRLRLRCTTLESEILSYTSKCETILAHGNIAKMEMEEQRDGYNKIIQRFVQDKQETVAMKDREIERLTKELGSQKEGLHVLRKEHEDTKSQLEQKSTALDQWILSYEDKEKALKKETEAIIDAKEQEMKRNRAESFAVKDFWEQREAARQQAIKDAQAALLNLRPCLGLAGVVTKTGDGLQITEVKKDLPAFRCGLQVGDILLRVGDNAIRGPDSLKEALKNVVLGSSVPVMIKRKAFHVYLLTLGARGLRDDELQTLIRTVEVLDVNWKTKIPTLTSLS